jgi:Arylsulfotransferase (ASST)
MKPPLIALLSAGLFSTLIGAASAAPSVYPTGVTVYDPAKAYGTYVVYGATDGKSYLVDMDGNEVHAWSHLGFPSEILDPKLTGGKRGHILVQLSTIDQSAQPFNGIFNNKAIGELDWDGKVLWQWGEQAPGGAARQNHDWNRLPNGNTLVVSTLSHVIAEFSDKPIADQAIYEVTPAGKIVWTWVASEHLKEFGLSAEGLGLLRKVLAHGFEGHGFLTINDMQPIGPNKWAKAGDKRFAPENIVIDSREASFIAIIDKKTGAVVWRVGPDYDAAGSTGNTPAFGIAPLRPTFSEKVPRPIDQTSGQHDAHIIPEGLPGAGNLLVFDNEGPSGYPPTRLGLQNGSRILEIDPVKKEIVWQYDAASSDQPNWSFYSAFISSARRLPNGNTLIDEGMNGRIFQVTKDGQIAWEFINPHFAPLLLRNGKQAQSNYVYRAQPVPYDWAPSGTPHAEKPIRTPILSEYHVVTP